MRKFDAIVVVLVWKSVEKFISTLLCWLCKFDYELCVTQLNSTTYVLFFY